MYFLNPARTGAWRGWSNELGAPLARSFRVILGKLKPKQVSGFSSAVMRLLGLCASWGFPPRLSLVKMPD
jgi:hypothetical protein